MERILTETQYLFFITLTSGAEIAGGVLLWLGFIFMGLISRRFEKAYGRITHWRFQWAAPSGIVAYLVMQAAASLQRYNLGPVEQWLGYALLIGSAWACLRSVFHFRKVLAEIL